MTKPIVNVEEQSVSGDIRTPDGQVINARNVVAAPLIVASGEPGSWDSAASKAGSNAEWDSGDDPVMSSPG